MFATGIRGNSLGVRGNPREETKEVEFEDPNGEQFVVG